MDVIELRLKLIVQSHQQRLPAGVVRMAGQQHALLVKHLQDRELRKVAELAALKGHVGNKDRVRACFRRHVADHRVYDQATTHQMLHNVGRAAAEDAQSRFLDLYPFDTGG